MFQLVNLLQSGDISPLSFGIGREEASRIVGAPEGEYEFNDSIIEKRGPIQLTFENDQLRCLIWHLVDPAEPPIQFNGDLPTSKTPIYQFIELCNEIAPDWHIDRRHTFDRQMTIRTSQGALAFYDLDACELQKILVSAHVDQIL